MTVVFLATSFKNSLRLLEIAALVWAGITLLAFFSIRMLHRSDRKKFRPMTAKAVGRVDEIDTQEDYDSDSRSTTSRYFASYTFAVDGMMFRGHYEEIGPFTKRGGEIVVYYNPLNPSENTTQYSKDLATGRWAIRTVGTIFGIIIFIPVLFLLL